MKTGKQLERYFKGVANHRRLEILMLIYKNDKMTLENITSNLNLNIKTASSHTQRLTHAGLLNKNYKGKQVQHSLSPYGKRFISFIKSF